MKHNFMNSNCTKTLLEVLKILVVNRFINVRFIAMDPFTEQILHTYLQNYLFGFTVDQVDSLEYYIDFKEFKTRIEIVRADVPSIKPVLPEYIFTYKADVEELHFMDNLPPGDVPKSIYMHTEESEIVIPTNKITRGDIHIVSHNVTPDITLEDVIKGDYSDTYHTLHLTNSDLVNSKGTALYFPLLKFIEGGNTICVSKEWTESMVELAKRSDRTITIVFE